MDSLYFIIPPTSGAEETPTQVRLYQSDTLVSTRTEVDTVSLASLGYTGNPPEELCWTLPDSDSTKFSWLVLVTAGGIEGQPALLAPAATTGLVSLDIWTESILGVAKVGLTFQAYPMKGFTSVGDKTLTDSGSDITDVNGFASLQLYADSGKYSISLAGKQILMQFDTAGKSGQSINIADLI